MDNKEIPHTIILALDPELINEPDFDPTDHNQWIIRIICPYAKDNFTRPCTVWRECDHPSDAVDENGKDIEDDDPCDESPSGRHSYIGGILSHPSLECWAQTCETTCDEISRLITDHKLTLGEHKVIIEPDEDAIYLELITGE
jgi:hypothetical protein